MFKNFFITLAFITAISCSTVQKNSSPEIDQEVTQASSSAKRVLATSDTMINKKEIVVGACWDFINTVYNRAGYSSKNRITIAKSSIKGPYLNADLVKPGDWLYFVNHSYHGVEHSAIFVNWTNKEKKEALMVSYVGNKKKKPAFYKKYVLTNIYNIIRPAGKE